MNELMDISSISFDDLQEEYQKLKEKFSQLIAISDQDRQRIHELKRSLDTATAAEAYLAQELEQISSVQTSQDDALLHKKQNEVVELKKRQGVLLTENEELHQDIFDLRAENEKLKQELKQLNSASRPAEISYQIPKEHLDLRDRLEAENLDLLAKLDEAHETIVKFTMMLAEKEKHIEIYKDQVICLEENLQSKREEVDEKSHLLESTQEQVVEMNAKIAMLTSCPDNADRKGNSLFAEVDDQRQAMKQLLAAQKKSYLQMKKTFNESQHEIRRLKRENVAMHNELQTCSTIFCSADKAYKEKLNERILQLLKQNEDLERKLMTTQQELLSMANDKGVVWLDSMLLFCKQETDEMKKQNHSMRIQKGFLEEQLRNSQQELAKWRFEALKTRCVLIDREGLLIDNKIEFKTFTNRDVTFSSDEIEKAKPNLGYVHQSREEPKKHTATDYLKTRNEFEKDNFIVIEDDEPVECPDKDQELLTAVSTIKTEKEDSLISDTSLIKKQNCEVKSEEIQEQKTDDYEHFDACIKTELTQSSELENIDKSNTEKLVSIKPECHNDSIEHETNHLESKENKNVLVHETLPKLNANSSLKESYINSITTTNNVYDSKLRPSILVTKKNIFNDESHTKTVHFAQSLDLTKSETTSDQKVACKPTRIKSSVVVRRLLVNSKNKSEPGATPIRH